MKSIALLGAGGMSSEVIPLLEKSYRYHINYLYDGNIKEEKYKGKYLITNKIDKHIPHLMAAGYPETKKLIHENIEGYFKLSSPYIHALCIMGNDINIGIGSIIYPMVMLSNNISIGVMSSVNSHVTIGHDCKIGEMFHASPGSVVSGNVTIGDRVFLGSNSTIKEKISVCSDVIIGAGSVIVKNIEKSGIYAGCPAKKI